MDFINVYEDQKRAAAYSKLEFPGTYYLAYRDLPEIIAEHVKGKSAIDFGCGTGRSSRFLRRLGFHVIGIDISKDMINQARKIDPEGDYRIVENHGFAQFHDNAFSLILSVFTFDNIAGREKRTGLLKEMRRITGHDGRIILLDSTPDIYTNEWASFTTKNFPENKHAGSGQKVKIIMTDVDDQRPVEDIIWFDEDYRELFMEAGLHLVKAYKPLAAKDEPYQWVNETEIAPWIIYILTKS
ncbi:MAG: class I SAM-dependent methyltransferase [Spirochaetales bacterium]|nr:class I SAM-dependent methyltransferase [Spirochaetales bacterium]